MNQRYQASLKNDPDLMLAISLTNVLIIKVIHAETKLFTLVLLD